jgi:hypothetical protein
MKGDDKKFDVIIRAMQMHKLEFSYQFRGNKSIKMVVEAKVGKTPIYTHPHN